MHAANSTTQPLYGAIEAGGTKFLCVLARGLDRVLDERLVPTTTPRETWERVLEFFGAAQAQAGEIAAFGVASFGPLDLDRRSPGWGRLLATPKPEWTGVDLVGPLVRRFGRPISLDTDVNAAAAAELALGVGRGCESLVYVTVGTGIGGGAMAASRTLRGALHPEMGHIRVRRHPRDGTFGGICPFHGDCLEGLASGPAIRARWGASLDQLGHSDEALDIIGHYLGQLAATIALMLSPERIVFGGGVMSGGQLLPAIRRATAEMLNGYLPIERFGGSFENFLGMPGLGARAGITGALMLAQAAGSNAAAANRA